MKRRNHPLIGFAALFVVLGFSTQVAFSATIIKNMPKKSLIVVKPESSEQDLLIGDKVRILDKEGQGVGRGKVIKKRPNRIAIRLKNQRLAFKRGGQVSVTSSKKSPSTEKKKDITGLFARINPFALSQDSYNGSVGIGVSDITTLGLMGSYVDSSDELTDFSGYMVGPQLSFHLDGIAEDGWFIKLVAGYADFSVYVYSPILAKSSEENDTFADDPYAEAHMAFAFGGGLGGYQWAWTNGIQINLGLGAVYNAYDETELTVTNSLGEEKTYTYDFLPKVMPTGEVSLGYML